MKITTKMDIVVFVQLTLIVMATICDWVDYIAIWSGCQTIARESNGVWRARCVVLRSS